MNPFFKHAEGEIAEYSEMKKNVLYKELIYSSEDQACIGDEARKFVMYSDTDWVESTEIDRELRKNACTGIYF